MPPRRECVIAAATLLLAAACAHGRSIDVMRPSRRACVIVSRRGHQRQHDDARVYAVDDRVARYPVATIGGSGHRVALGIPWQPRVLGFEIDLLVGAGAFLADRLRVEPGDTVALRLPANHAASGFRRIA